MNFKDLNRILKAEIFLHKDGQLRAAHIILGYKLSTKHFQSPKNVIRAKDPGFLLFEPPLEGTQDAQLLAPLAARLLYSQELTPPSGDEGKESTSESVQEVTDKDFEVFYCTDASGTSQAHTSADMGFEKKTPDLLALLTADAGGSFPVVAVVPQPPTPAATHTSSDDTGDKKWKRAQGGKDV